MQFRSGFGRYPVGVELVPVVSIGGGMVVGWCTTERWNLSKPDISSRVRE